MMPCFRLPRHERRHGTLLTLVLCLLALCMAQNVSAQKKNTRPTDNRIYLDHADSLYYDKFRLGDKQVVRGHVKFRHKGATLFCDSAYFKQQENKFEAYGHVRMLQGDTLEIRCDTAVYEGNAEMVNAKHNVVVIHRKTSELHTDNLVYDQKFEVVYYDQGGNYADRAKGMTLSSDWKNTTSTPRRRSSSTTSR